MRSLRSAARNVAVFQWPCGILATSLRPRRRPAVEPGHVGLGPGLVDEDQSRRIDALLMASPAPAMALYVRAILLARDERLFFERDADAAEEAAHHRRVGSHPTLRQQPVAKRLQSDVGFLCSQRLEILTMRLKPRQVFSHLLAARRTAPLEALHPLDRQESLTPNRAAAALRLIPPRSTASITRSRKSCEYALAIPAGLRPASRLNQNAPPIGNPEPI